MTGIGREGHTSCIAISDLYVAFHQAGRQRRESLDRHS